MVIILRLFDGLANFSSTTSKTNGDYQLQTGIHAQPHEVPYDIRLRVLENQEISGKSQKCKELLPSAQSSSRNKNFASTSKNLLKKRNWIFPVVLYFTSMLVCLKYFVNDCRLIPIGRIEWSGSLFVFLTENTLFRQI